ncbi:endopeptidase La [Halosquirtibacter xylanolyticus]|uniref:endopeptidase La n=1 Tax=Halosquirtibacter xylanolyticus TaxID=3374599 RepID=UPI003749DB62|nr:endopeptidase La [Prolixibacteraceae bacterium]
MGEDYIPIIADGNEADLAAVPMPDALPILPLRNTVLFPGVVMPITVGRKKSLELIREAYADNRLIGTIAQKEGKIEDPTKEDMYQVGTMAEILKILEMPDGSTSVVIQGKRRFKVLDIFQEDPYFRALVVPTPEDLPDTHSREFDAVISTLKELAGKIVAGGADIPAEAQFALKNIENSTFLINFLCNNSNVTCDERQELLELDSIRSRGGKLITHLVKEVQVIELKQDIQNKVKTDMDQQQREYLLHQQMKTIQDELGGNPLEQEIEEFRVRADEKQWSKEIAEIFYKELDKLQRLNPAAGEYSVQSGYVEMLLDLPWGECSEDNFNMDHAEEVLDADHYGLEKVKDRILEHLAVLKLKGDMKSPILCLYGPPGVGKTSLGKSIAKSLDREYVRMSLGGLHDESEIRGHRRTYIGAMPGRIIQNIKKAGTSNPVFILDEIDKISNDFHGDPASALLEVLDPEQNATFHDNYLDIDYDLSKVMFIATANSLSSLHPALRDRMELIDVSGYLVEEKIEIAKRHLLPRQIENHGLNTEDVLIDDKAIEAIIDRYTRESGVRLLDKMMAKLCRRIAKKVAFGNEYNKAVSVDDLKEYLGTSVYTKELYEGNEYAGVVTGLAWTAVGGEILYIETSINKGNGKLTLTGNLGEVMKESAMIAMQYLRAHAEEFDIDPKILDKWNVHVHVPEGAIPKDGPSAGITMATALASSFTQRKVKKNIAMTGEITLRGKVLPVGGIKEKILAAKRSGVKEIILSEDNKKDIEDIKELYIQGLKFHYVRNISDVLSVALLKSKVDNAISFKE